MSVQIMRAVAALMVVLLHAQTFGGHTQGIDASHFRAFEWIQLGNGVDIFFVISGFVITVSSRRLVAQRDLVGFARRRLIRIVPLYWLVLFIWIALLAVKGVFLGNAQALSQLSVSNLAGSYFFFPVDAMGYGPRYPFPLLDLGWTLNFEMFFYLIFGACLLLGPARFQLRVWSVLLLFVLAGGLMPEMSLPWSFWTQPILLEFLAGVAIAQLYEKGVRIDGRLQVLLIAVGVAVWLLLRERSFGPIPIEAKGSYGWPRVLSGGLGAAFIMAGAALGRHQWAGNLSRFGATLGESSYALYLTHALTFTAWRIGIETLDIRFQWSWSLTIALTLSAMAVAHVIHVLVERPLTTWLTHRSGSSSKEVAGASGGPFDDARMMRDTGAD